MKSDVTSKNKISKKREDMSKLDELIKELCPNGVEYKELGEIFNLKNGYTPSKSNLEYWENGDVNWFRIEDINTNGGILENSIQRVNIKGIKGNLFVAKSLIVSTTATIGKHALILKEFICNQQFTCLTIKENYEKIYNSKFMYYYFFKISEFVKKNLKVSSFPSVDMDKFKKFLIPLPPLEVQDDIVKILDNYTKSVEELKEKLNKELTARKKQYSWYRDYLLTFKNKIKIMKLGDLFELKNGYTPSKSNSEYWENGDTNWFKIEDINTNGRVLSNSLEKVNKKGVKGKLFPENTLIISTSATIGEYALITKEFLCNQRFTCLITKEEYKDVVLPMFLKHYAYILSKKCRENIKVGNFPSVDMDKFKKFLIPLPPLEVQKRIVEVLDNFEKTCKELNIELSSEIEIKQKEYEFIRNYLLTFEEKSRQAILACELASLRACELASLRACVASSKPKI